MGKYEDLIKRLRDIASHDSNIESNYIGLALLQAVDAIEALSKTEKTTQWIPVTERLPEQSGTYLVYVYGDVTDLNYWRGEWHRLGDDYTKAVTHWMPLPEPPKEET